VIAPIPTARLILRPPTAGDAHPILARYAADPEVARFALCHVSHADSIRVLERCGFAREATLTKYAVFPNLGDDTPQDVACHVRSGHAGRSG
jgi:RimJ/RimL family protein N-acetyltransferase